MTRQLVTRREALVTAAAGTVALVGCQKPPAADEEGVLVPPEGALPVLTPVGSSTWDATYYQPKYANQDEARSAGEQVARRVEEEGIVLLRNAGDLLPLEPGTSVSLLGRSAVDTIFGGTGAAGIDFDACIPLREGLEQAGFIVNELACDWIASTVPDYPRGAVGQLDRPSTVSHYIGEIPWDAYPADVVGSLAGTVGIVVLGRPGAEGDDLSFNLLADLEDPEVEAFVPNRETEGYVPGQHQLELTREELSLIEGAKAACDQVVVLLNVATTMEVGPLVEEGGIHEVPAIVEIGFPGAVGALAVGDVLVGATNPSGRTCDLWATDLTATPSFNNFAARRYVDVDDHYTQLGSNAYFVEYAEGIYVGYRYYETAAALGTIDYDTAVTFPFGFGLSYTSFEQTLDAMGFQDDEAVPGGQVEVTVTVTTPASVPARTSYSSTTAHPGRPAAPR